MLQIAVVYLDMDKLQMKIECTDFISQLIIET